MRVEPRPVARALLAPRSLRPASRATGILSTPCRSIQQLSWLPSCSPTLLNPVLGREPQYVRNLSYSPLVLAKKKKKSGQAPISGASEGSNSRYPPLPPGWNAVIGVECHAQIKDDRKLFSSAPIPTSSSPPNTLVTAFDAAYPGTLPVLNQSALKLAIRAALALGCQIHPESRFDRKHYFYPDLPAGYQITQKYAPLANKGKVLLRFEDGHLPRPEDQVDVEIEQLQIEQDTAKSTYFDTGTTSRADGDDSAASLAFIDLNRAGVGLMEIVSGPQMRSPEQAGAYVRKLQELLRRVGASDGNMQEGSLRCDVNVSVHRDGEPFGTRCEIKNLNSVRFMMNAISFESHRQVALLEEGQAVEQETRGYDEAHGNTFRLRGKEDAPDYRYMPDPNLPPVRLTREELDKISASLPELPDVRRARLESQYGLGWRDINVLMRVGAEDEGAGRGVSADDAVEYFERVAAGRDAQVAMNWIIHELLKGLNGANLAFSADRVTAEQLGELIDLVESGRVTGTTAKALLGELIMAPRAIESVLDELSQRGLLALTSREDVLPLCRAAIEALPQEAGKVRSGNVKVAMRIVGHVMKEAQGRADAKMVHEVILDELGLH